MLSLSIVVVPLFAASVHPYPLSYPFAVPVPYRLSQPIHASSGASILPRSDDLITCKPNFQSTAVTITTTTLKPGSTLTLATTASPADGVTVDVSDGKGTRFVPECTGEPKNDYIVKLAGIRDNSLLLAMKPDGKLEIGTVLATGSPAFTIDCDECASPAKPYAPGDSVGKACRFTYAATEGNVPVLSPEAVWDFVAA